jgi:hypothetical protein
MAEPPSDLIATMIDPMGRTVWLAQRSWDHVTTEHPEVRLAELKRAVETAEKRTSGKFAGTEKLWARNLGPAKWLTVVVAYEGRVGRVRTALGSTKDPRERDVL